tara:strand:+ start:193 stop:372 length:180 start_codon:yes stop_codon:yes gene_type:complete
MKYTIGSTINFNGSKGIVEDLYLIGDDADLVYVVFEIDTGKRKLVLQNDLDWRTNGKKN